MEDSIFFQSTHKQECRVESDTNPTVYGCLLKFSMGFVYNLTEFQHYDKLVSKTRMCLICQIYVFFRENAQDKQVNYPH